MENPKYTDEQITAMAKGNYSLFQMSNKPAEKPIFEKGEVVWKYRSTWTHTYWERVTVAEASKAKVTLEHQYGSAYHWRPAQREWATPERNSQIYKLDDPWALVSIKRHELYEAEQFEREHPLLPINQGAASIVDEIKVTPCARIESQAAFAWQMVGGVEIRFGDASAATMTFVTTAQIEKLIDDLQVAQRLIARARMPESKPAPIEKCWRGFAYNERGEKVLVTVPPSDSH